MSAKNKNRGADPSSMTVHKLCARAAGRCQFSGCNKKLFIDEITWDEFNNSNIAHIVAASPNGPRGDENRSYELSDKIDNLMLMCLDHHKLIDSNPCKYTVQALSEMKQEHEKMIAEQCDLIYKQPTEIVMLVSPIKGKNIPADVSIAKAAEAVMPDKRPASTYGQRIEINSASGYRSREFWDEAEKQLEARYNRCVSSMQVLKLGIHFSVFPMAPIPLIMKLGYIMGDKMQVDVYQKSRNPDTWSWKTTSPTNDFSVKETTVRAGNRIALVLSLTADISQKRVLDAYDADVIFTISANHFGVDCINSVMDLSAFWHKYQEVCDEIRNRHTQTQEIAVFPAIPVSAAFEVGRRFMPGVYPKLIVFDDDKGFFETLTIGD